MPTLRELQLGFAEALLSESATVSFAPRVWSKGLSRERRLRIYRNNLFANLSSALEAVFPVTQRLVGEVFFSAAARGYVRAQPSLSGDIHLYGDRFGEFLATLPGTWDHPYLKDVAELEWAYHKVFHTEPGPPLDPSSLHHLPADRYSELRFDLQPAARLLASKYPVLRIWQVNQPGWEGDDRVDLGEGGCRVLVLRCGAAIQLEALSPGEHAWLDALAQGQVLVAALETAFEVDSAFDLGPVLAHRVEQGVLVPAGPRRDFLPDVHLNP